MRRKMILSWLWAALILIGPAYGDVQGQTLHAKDVRSMMNQFFEYHIEDHEMTTELIGRSLRLYIEDFDADRLYLLDKEFIALSQPSDEDLQLFLKQYKQDDLAPYQNLDKALVTVIERARKWREELYKQQERMFAAADETLPTMPEGRPFASSEAELKQRMQDLLVLFIADQKAMLSSPLSDSQKQKIFALYERKVRQHECPYLGQDLTGHPLDPSKAESQLVVRVLKADAKSLDAHTAYFSPEDAYNMRSELEEGLAGIGVVVEEGIEGIVISKVVAGTPAAESGKIFAQDRIVQINGKSILDAPFSQILEEMHGKEGSPITLGIIHQGDASDKVQQVSLDRVKIVFDEQKIQTSFEAVDGGIIGKIRLHVFYEGDDDDNAGNSLRLAIAQLRQKGNLKGLILDLRDNPGGFLTQAVKVSGLFISSGVVVIAEYAGGQVRYFRDINERTYFDGPLVILTSKMTASAAEIVAQALQDYGAGLVVGDAHTFGKGSIQYQTITDDNADSLYKVTVGRYYTPSGRSTQLQGVLADIVVPTAFADAPISEAQLEFPLSSHNIAPGFQDNLSDIQPAARQWYAKYYLPYLQAKRTQWTSMLPTLRKRSAARLASNPEFQEFLKLVAEGEYPAVLRDSEGKSIDIQMKEAVNIVKDMVSLESQGKASASKDSAASAPSSIPAEAQPALPGGNK